MAQRAGAGGLYLLGGDVASGIVLIVVAGVCNAGAGQVSVDRRAELVDLVVVNGGLVLAGAASRLASWDSRIEVWIFPGGL